jgi:hypothetical protein
MVFWNSTDSIRGIAVGVSFGEGVSFTVGKSWSQVIQFNNPIEANIARGAWDALNPGLAVTQLLDKDERYVDQAILEIAASRGNPTVMDC